MRVNQTFFWETTSNSENFDHIYFDLEDNVQEYATMLK
jgi:hypothetical protein